MYFVTKTVVVVALFTYTTEVVATCCPKPAMLPADNDDVATNAESLLKVVRPEIIFS
jgi:hypothetical protein